MVTGTFHQCTHAVVFYISLTLGTSTAESGSSDQPVMSTKRYSPDATTPGLHGADVTLDDSEEPLKHPAQI